jgi:predicted membrane protein
VKRGDRAAGNIYIALLFWVFRDAFRAFWGLTFIGVLTTISTLNDYNANAGFNKDKEEDMKMNFLFTGVFWGVVLILIGLGVIINVVFGVKIPIFRTIFALFLIYLGIQMLTGTSWHKRSEKVVMFEEKKIETITKSDKYDVIFGKGEIDLTGIKPDSQNIGVEINTVFGGSVVKINPAVPTKMIVSSAFGGAHLPDGNVVAFGQYTYKTESYRENEKHLLIRATVVFGGMEFLSR